MSFYYSFLLEMIKHVFLQRFLSVFEMISTHSTKKTKKPEISLIFIQTIILFNFISQIKNSHHLNHMNT